MSNVIVKQIVEGDIDRTLEPYTGIVWQDLAQTAGIVKQDDFFPVIGTEGGKGQVLAVVGPGKVALAPTPRTLLGLAPKLLRKFKPGSKTAPKAEPVIPVPPSVSTQILDGYIRVYLAADVDLIIEQLHALLHDFIDLSELSQPAHAPRRRKTVASRN